MKKVHILAAAIFIIFSSFLIGCSNGVPELPQVDEAIEWAKDKYVQDMPDAGPFKAPFMVSMFVNGNSLNSFPENKGVEDYVQNDELKFTLQIVNATEIYNPSNLQDLELLHFTPSITIRTGKQVETAAEEYVIRMTFPELKDVILKPGESYTATWKWKMTDQERKKIEPGVYYAAIDPYNVATPITYEDEDGNTVVQNEYECMPLSQDMFRIVE